MASCNWRAASYLALAVLLVGLDHALAYSMFRDRIPNGDKVPHPCNPLNVKWRGVGHLAEGGGGPRNPFGLDFDAAGRTWTRALCQKDSDGDGVSNGEELGDPSCTWTQGTKASNDAQSHPGFCDSSDSSGCTNKLPADFCANTEFNCSALQEEGVFEFSVRFPESPVPAKETTYKCMQFEFPQDKDYHMTAFMEEIDVIDVMHHIIVYGCSDDNYDPNTLNQPYDCFMSGGGSCETFLGLWALGQHGFCFHPNAGIKVGKTGFKRAVLELHWNNPWKSSTYVDSSGVKFYLNPNLRQYEAGILSVGPFVLEIPPGEKSHVETGFCSGQCTGEVFKGPINVIATTNHMHYLGKQAVSKVVRKNQVEYLAYDTVFDYDKPVVYQFSDPIKVNPGDRIQIDCTYNSEDRTATTEWGYDTYAEMCYTFITYYPRENVPFSGKLQIDRLVPKECTSNNEFDTCELESTNIRGCDIAELSDTSNPRNIQRYMNLSEHCAVGYCKKSCMNVVKQIYEEPCFKQPLRNLLIKSSQESESCEIIKFYAWMTSCDKELYEQEMEKLRTENENNDKTNTAALHVISASVMAFMLSCLWLF